MSEPENPLQNRTPDVLLHLARNLLVKCIPGTVTEQGAIT